jgi:hypothetical protein
VLDTSLSGFRTTSCCAPAVHYEPRDSIAVEEQEQWACLLAILNQGDGGNQATGRISKHIEAAILPIVRNGYRASCDTFGISPSQIEEPR